VHTCLLCGFCAELLRLFFRFISSRRFQGSFPLRCPPPLRFQAPRPSVRTHPPMLSRRLCSPSGPIDPFLAFSWRTLRAVFRFRFSFRGLSELWPILSNVPSASGPPLFARSGPPLMSGWIGHGCRKAQPSCFALMTLIYSPPFPFFFCGAECPPQLVMLPRNFVFFPFDLVFVVTSYRSCSFLI